MTAAGLPEALVVRLAIEPIVAPVLSLTGIPTVKAPAVALVSVLAPVFADDGAELSSGGPDDDEAAGAATEELAYRAVAAASTKSEARIGVSLGVTPLESLEHATG